MHTKHTRAAARIYPSTGDLEELALDLITVEDGSVVIRKGCQPLLHLAADLVGAVTTVGDLVADPSDQNNPAIIAEPGAGEFILIRLVEAIWIAVAAIFVGDVLPIVAGEELAILIFTTQAIRPEVADLGFKNWQVILTIPYIHITLLFVRAVGTIEPSITSIIRGNHLAVVAKEGIAPGTVVRRRVSVPVPVSVPVRVTGLSIRTRASFAPSRARCARISCGGGRGRRTSASRGSGSAGIRLASGRRIGRGGAITLGVTGSGLKSKDREGDKDSK